MTRRLATLAATADQFDALVLDQWGVLHDGTAPYPGAITCLEDLKSAGCRMAVLSNSGKRSAPNAARIAGMGFDPALFEVVMTSGEALWRDIDSGAVAERRFFPIERAPGDAAQWADGLDIVLTDTLDSADAILLMGLPDTAAAQDYAALFDDIGAAGLPVICTNPDRSSPRGDGQIVTSPGALAHDFAAAGGTVRFYGKPHGPVFRAVETALCVAPHRTVMVGDSLEHDIAGGNGAGWATVFVEGGLYAAAFAGADHAAALARLVAAGPHPAPDFSIARLQ